MDCDWEVGSRNIEPCWCAVHPSSKVKTHPMIGLHVSIVHSSASKHTTSCCKQVKLLHMPMAHKVDGQSTSWIQHPGIVSYTHKQSGGVMVTIVHGSAGGHADTCDPHTIGGEASDIS
jgi:hypothetical protein